MDRMESYIKRAEVALDLGMDPDDVVNKFVTGDNLDRDLAILAVRGAEVLIAGRNP